MIETYTLQIESSTDNLARVDSFIQKIGKENNLPCSIIDEVVISVDEAVSNIIIHAYNKDPNGIIEIKVTVDPSRVITIKLYDTGEPFDPSIIKPPVLSSCLDDRPIGGLGLYLMKKFMNEVCFSFDESHSQNKCTMTKYLH